MEAVTEVPVMPQSEKKTPGVFRRLFDIGVQKLLPRKISTEIGVVKAVEKKVFSPEPQKTSALGETKIFPPGWLDSEYKKS